MTADNTERFGFDPISAAFPAWLNEFISIGFLVSFWGKHNLGYDAQTLSLDAINRLVQAKLSKEYLCKTYVFKTLSNLAKDRYRKESSDKRKREAAKELAQTDAKQQQDSNTNSATEEIQELKLTLLRAEIERLSLRDRVIVNLRHVPYKMTYTEIAKIICLSESTARQECKRIEQMLNARVTRKLENMQFPFRARG